MLATDELKAEHRGIEIMLRILGQLADAAQSGRGLDKADAADVIEFLRTFADKCHHSKEEDLLFPALEAAGIPRQGGPVGVMLHEHDIGRGFIKGMSDSLASGDMVGFAGAARGYIELLSNHIAKEDNVLFKMADQALSPQKQEELVRAFAAMERDHMGEGVHEAFHAMMDRLAVKYLG
ncbi:hemerythrin domain-containing protein [Fundidesulfovibrio terrae]|uniref:hemerythrin domain-containing protein n=1 Tax=Fundidesulfovibrio terrae TaxID=2922866 RepID=UPI001FAFBE9D|nr:hemerythrin domain-containing protein [Fundidesulfovibrio terrae]